VAPFSSTGLAFDGHLKPDVVAPGVDVPAGRVRVSGSSAAAAVVAGAAALLAQARPGLDAQTLDGLIVATARPLPHEPVTAQGAGVLDIGAAAAGEVAVAGGTLTNVSVRTIRIRQRTLRPGERIAVRGPAVVTVPGGGTVRVTAPLVHVQPVDLIAGASISRNGRLLTGAAGRVERVHGGIALRPVARLDVVIGGLGLVARVRDALPGRYTFGLSGPPGSYAVTVLAYPVDGGPPSRKTLHILGSKRQRSRP
jgi:Subtilase family